MAELNKLLQEFKSYQWINLTPRHNERNATLSSI